MTAINVTVTGNLTGDPELRYTPSGAPVAQFTVASNERYKDGAGQWQDGPTSFVRCNAWRELAEHAAESLSKGDRVIVSGTMRQRDYQAQDGTKRTVWEVAVFEVGAALKYATVKISKARRDGAPIPEDPWAATGGPADSDAPAEEPPF
ncbi:MAG: single-stranded DNA-binding protein [Streptosporangiaceae bacterium]